MYKWISPLCIKMSSNILFIVLKRYISSARPSSISILFFSYDNDKTQTFLKKNVAKNKSKFNNAFASVIFNRIDKSDFKQQK